MADERSIDPNNMSEPLRNFLIKENALHKFLIACRDLRGSLDKDIKGLGSAFTWEESTDGHDFWSALDKKYSKQRWG